ncbi:MAG TPA: XRE family transcriptional regulator [Candidatus Baltobacteraceae bacterium]|jgi:transcriptional regulator with XRE-family HTH domain|nr:XRE family transcriptional regulator [Candidatus Baltobacteraceae bacterium]
MRKRPSTKKTAAEPDDGALLTPDVGKILERVRTQRGMTVRELADKSGLSASFIRAVERGDSDIAIGRLAKLASVFHYDLGSFLGFTAQLTRPTFITGSERKRVNRGKGVDYEVLHLPALDLDLVDVRLTPGASFKNELSHEGIDVVYVTKGQLVLEVNHIEYPMAEGECCVFAAGFPHKLRNDSKSAAAALSITTGRM